MLSEEQNNLLLFSIRHPKYNIYYSNKKITIDAITYVKRALTSITHETKVSPLQNDYLTL